MSKKEYFAIGTYTMPVGHAPNACGNGIDIISIDSSYELELLHSYKDIKNPSYLFSEDKSLYSITENDEMEPTVYRFDIQEDHNINPIESVQNKGKFLCHIIKHGNLIFTASYNDGCIYKYDLVDQKITLREKYLYEGSGPNKNRQEMPHAHQVVIGPQNRLYVCDLGTDRIWIHNIDDLLDISYLKTPSGYGPRHLVLDSKMEYLYILCELVPKLLVCKIDKKSGLFKIVQELDSVTDIKGSKSAPAAIKIHPSGKTLVVSNRFDDTIALFDIQNEVKLIKEFSCFGKTPRDITFSKSGDCLLIGNQDSSDITTIPFNKDSGISDEKNYKLFKIGTPVCIVSLD